MIGLYFAGKENRFPMTLFFFIETDSSVEMLLTFVHFSYMQQTFIETLICSRHCIRCWQCKETQKPTQLLVLIKGCIVLLDKERWELC